MLEGRTHDRSSSVANSDWPQWTCPVHRTVLTDDGARLVCVAGHNYDIVGGIPRFVPASSYADHFGLQWNVHARTQLDSTTGKPITRERLERIVGCDLWETLAGKHVLECGCGAGRFTEILLARGAYVTSIDLSNAVEANKENTPVGERHRIAQADITALPFPEQSFDVVLCLGVVQHTPNSSHTISELYRFVRPGGSLLIDHYNHKLRWYTTVAPLVRKVLKRLPAERSLVITNMLVDFFLPWHKRVAHIRPLRILLSRVSPIQCYYNEHPELDDKQQREWALLDTHDSLTDWYKHLRSRQWVRRQLEALRLVDIWCEPGGNGTEARGKRPRSR